MYGVVGCDRSSHTFQEDQVSDDGGGLICIGCTVSECMCIGVTRPNNKNASGLCAPAGIGNPKKQTRPLMLMWKFACFDRKGKSTYTICFRTLWRTSCSKISAREGLVVENSIFWLPKFISWRDTNTNSHAHISHKHLHFTLATLADQWLGFGSVELGTERPEHPKNSNVVKARWERKALSLLCLQRTTLGTQASTNPPSLQHDPGEIEG
jgi:hypothetical protein